MPIVPYKLVCLVSLFTVRAIADDAFETGFHSCNQVLYPPPLEKGIDFVPLKWKPEILDREIVPISYGTFLDTWNRAYFVAGSREKKRPYSPRVGAGSRLNGKVDLQVKGNVSRITNLKFRKPYPSTT